MIEHEYIKHNKNLFVVQNINRMYKMETLKQINIKNRTYYFYNDMIDIENFESNLLKINKNSCKDIGIYNIGYVTIKEIGDCKNIYSVNPLYLRITHASGYIEKINENKYLIFDSMELHSIDENKELKNTMMFLMELWIKLKK